MTHANRRLRCILCGLTLLLASGQTDLIAAPVDFDRELAPLLARRCLGCHAGEAPEGQLDLTRLEAARLGGDSGPAIIPREPSRSPLWQRIAADEMPPQEPLSESERETIRRWIADGAEWPSAIDPLRYSSDARAGYDWWSLQPLTRPAVPTGDETWSRNPIDRFISARWADQQLGGNLEADRGVLIRRLSFDLLGLPPSLDDVREFLNDPAPDAYERLVERYLASPHYGERWGRHWLDVVRFGESHGFERDLPRPHAWQYRDWVIAAFNSDLPYDEFVRWQLAGDAFSSDEREAARALGFLVAGPHNTVIPVSNRMRQVMRQDEMEDLLGVIGQSFLGLSIHCARCHDHKFDPVASQEYYQLLAVFTGVQPAERQVLPISAVRQREQWRQALGPLERQAAVDNAPADALLTVLKQQIAALENSAGEKVYTANFHQPAETRALRRGNVTEPLDAVTPAALSAVVGWPGDLQLRGDALEQPRRERFARWITHPQNPLFVRVIANRLWHYHFGRGLVATPNDLGFHGGQPSHPALLDWLASELLSHEFQLKSLHRLMVTSATYRQSSQWRADAAAVDADNRFLWRMSPRRLDAESLRDAALAVADQWNDTLGGPSYADFHSHFFKGTQFYDPIDPTDYSTQRRTIYRMWARGGRNPWLDNFDCPDPSTTAPQRTVTTTPLQALSLLNNPFLRRMSGHLAGRLELAAGDDADRQIELAYELLYARRPDEEERADSRAFIATSGLPAACLAWLNSSEFVYVD